MTQNWSKYPSVRELVTALQSQFPLQETTQEQIEEYLTAQSIPFTVLLNSESNSNLFEGLSQEFNIDTIVALRFERKFPVPSLLKAGFWDWLFAHFFRIDCFLKFYFLSGQLIHIVGKEVATGL